MAVKFLPFDRVRDEVTNKRFIQEACAASAIDHPNICTIYDIKRTESRHRLPLIATGSDAFVQRFTRPANQPET